MPTSVIVRKASIYLCSLVIIITICLRLVAVSMGAPGTDSNWTSPSATTVQKVGVAPDIPEQPNLYPNLDCTTLTYRFVNDSTLQTGCFMPTAFGLMDPDQQIVIFNGTDEAVPITPFSVHELLTPWPKTADVLALDAASTGGSWISLYKDLSLHLDNRHDLLGQLIDKQVNQPPDSVLRDGVGKALAINSGTLAFSDNGSWLVAESLSGAFLRFNLASLDSIPFAPSFGSQGSAALLKSQVSISNDGRYAVIQNNVADSFIVYDLSTCQANPGFAYQNCASHDYEPFLHAHISGLTTISHVRFLNDGLISFNARDGTNNSTYELAPSASIGSLIDYLALGDSYTSGEGAFDYIDGTDTDEDMCHLSGNSYPLLLTRDLFTASSGHSVACSGARIEDVMPSQASNYRGQVENGTPFDQRSPDSVAQLLASYMPGYLAQADFVSHYQPDRLTVSVGGNDIGFADMLEACAEAKFSRHASDNTCYSTYEDRLEIKNLIDRTIPRWVATYKYLQQRDPKGHIFVIGYPQIANDTGNCGLNVHLNKSELELSIEMATYLNDSIKQAAGQAGVTYIDISQALVGHRLCETNDYDTAVNGLTAGKDAGILGLNFLGSESYHPNAFGQALIEAAILKQSHSLAIASSGTNPTNDSPPDGTSLLNAPKTGRPITELSPTSDLISPLQQAGSSTAVAVTGRDRGLLSNTGYTVRLDGSTGATIGTISSDGQTNISGQVTIPASTTPGGHTIDITGPTQNEQTIDIQQPIYVTSGGSDSDGDGITDANDSCPYIPNSGVDADHDGIDDACDGFIGNATPPPEDQANSVTTSPTVVQNGQTTIVSTMTTTQTPPQNSQPSDTTTSAQSTEDAITLQTTAQADVLPASSVLKSTVKVAKTLRLPLIHSSGSKGDIVGSQVLGVHIPAQAIDHHSESAEQNPTIIHWLGWASLSIISLLAIIILAEIIAGRQKRKHQ